MSDDFQFRFSVPEVPEGEALTAAEVEARLVKQLEDRGGDCPATIRQLANVYSRTGRPEQALRCIKSLMEVCSDPEEHAHYCLSLGCQMEKMNDFAAATSSENPARAC